MDEDDFIPVVKHHSDISKRSSKNRKIRLQSQEETKTNKCEVETVNNKNSSNSASSDQCDSKLNIIKNSVDREDNIKCEDNIKNVKKEIDSKCSVSDYFLKGKLENSEKLPPALSDSNAGNSDKENAVTEEDTSKQVIVCPLCWKKFEKNQLQTSHLKSCAAKHNVDTRTLLNALELQKKQAAEREALGLPDLVVNKKPVARKGLVNSKDINLQLALALSASLQEAEEKEEDDIIEVGFVDGVMDENMENKVVQKQKVLLEQYGFTSSKPPLPCSSKNKSGVSKLKYVPPLLSRSAEERERLITEKVAIILMGEEDSQELSNKDVLLPFGRQNDTHPPGSCLLQKCYDEDTSLWHISSTLSDVQSSRDVYYVQDLSSSVSPSKVEPGSKVQHLSQIHDFVCTGPETKVGSCWEMDEPSENSAVGPFDMCKTFDLKSVKPCDMKENSKYESNTIAASPLRCKSKGSFFSKNVSPASSLVGNWKSMVNKNTMSDVTIYTKDDREIFAHKLVFHVRCPAILVDLIKQVDNGSGCVSEMLMWPEISYRAALAFLEFIYCGETNRILRLTNDLDEVKLLAERYTVCEILDHIDVMSRVRGKVTSPFSCEKGGTPSPGSDRAYSHSSSKNRSHRKENIAENISASQESCLSPDLFVNDTCNDDDDSPQSSQESRKSIEILLSLMNKSQLTQSCATPSRKKEESPRRCDVDCNDPDVVTPLRKSDLCISPASLSNHSSPSIKSNKRKCSSSASSSVKKRCFIEVEGNDCLNVSPAVKDNIVTLDLTQNSDSDDEIEKSVLSQSYKKEEINKPSELGLGSSLTEKTFLYSLHESNPQSKSNTPTTSGSYISNVWEDFQDVCDFPDTQYTSSPDSKPEMSSPNKSLSSQILNRPSSKLSNKNKESVSPVCNSTSFPERKKELNKSQTAQEIVSDCSKSDTESPRKIPCAVDNYKALLNDSFADNFSVFSPKIPDKNPSSSRHSSKSKHDSTPSQLRGSSGSSSPAVIVSDQVTPRPEYTVMKTPDLEKELNRFGIKNLKKNQAKKLLRHIYNELHPLVPAHESEKLDGDSPFKQPGADVRAPKSPRKGVVISPEKKRNFRRNILSSSQVPYSKSEAGSSSECEDLPSSQDSSTSSEGCVAEEMLSGNLESLNHQNEEDNPSFSSAVRSYIVSNPDLYKQVLRYEPIWFEELEKNLKAQNLKFKSNQLMDYLDEQCVTFRTVQGQKSRIRRKERRKRRNTPKKK